MTPDELPFEEAYVLDFEFSSPVGERSNSICMVAKNIKSGQEKRYWRDELSEMQVAPFSEKSLLIAYYSSAEIGCFLSLGWPVEFSVLDLFIEFRSQTNGTVLPSGRSLLGALIFYGLPAMNVDDKEAMRTLAVRGGDYTLSEKQDLLDYCAEDVVALERLLPYVLARMSLGDLQRALLRGRYMIALARMEFAGIPMDRQLLDQLNGHWDWLRDELIEELDVEYGVYEKGKFRLAHWEKWLEQQSIPWPRSEFGRLKLDDDTFKQVGKSYPEVETMRQLRHATSQLRLNSLAVGDDDRNRVMLSAFRSKTSRNQPSTSAFLFGLPSWMRFLIQASPGHAVAYIDWSQQEWGIAGYLSGDPRMIEAYESDDPYITFARMAGAVPMGATKATHPHERLMFKSCALAVQYGMEAGSLGRGIGVSLVVAENLLRLHHETFHVYWKWSDEVLDHALTLGRLHTVFGWNIKIGEKFNARSIRNFPMQANGAEMLRLACIGATEDGIEVCAPIHDAVLIHAPVAEIHEVACRTQRHMARASSLLLDGPELKTDVEIFEHPTRFTDPRGEVMFGTVQRLLNRCPSPLRS